MLTGRRRSYRLSVDANGEVRHRLHRSHGHEGGANRSLVGHRDALGHEDQLREVGVNGTQVNHCLFISFQVMLRHTASGEVRPKVSARIRLKGVNMVARCVQFTRFQGRQDLNASRH